MRLKCLDLTRYGKFTDHRIEFGERVEGQPDLHIVYGPNEAGKSTALAGFLDLLFGIETRSRFNFIHPYPTMRVGGTLELAGGPQALVRIKRPQNSLLDVRDQPIAEGTLLGELGGIDRDSYRTMFSLDDATLEAGGESILSSKGDLGQLLFSASAGLADLSKGLVDLKAEAEGFYKYRARSGELSDLKARLAELKAERERVDTLASDYAQLIEARDRAAIQYEEAIGSRGKIQARMDEIQRHLNALPRLTDLRGLRQRIAPLADLPDPPRGWAEELPQLQKDEIELGIRAQGLTEEIAELSGQLDAIVVDETALRLADKVERLADLRARHVTAEKDIPERHMQLREAELAISAILGRIERTGETDPHRLVLGASVVGALRTLIETRSGIEAALNSTADELSEARRRLDEAQARLGEAGGDPETGRGRETRMSSLAAAVAAARADDHAARRRLKLGAAAAEQALRAYRDRHRSSMITRASQAFATISRGAYTGLAAQPEKDGEILIALAAGGGSKEAAELSKGTRFQLYLALRVAGYYEFVISRQPVPFIADDIMETFDDFRAEEAFRLFGEMAQVGQVIYLTHHPHLCEIARQVCPTVKVHHLAADSL